MLSFMCFVFKLLLFSPTVFYFKMEAEVAAPEEGWGIKTNAEAETTYIDKGNTDVNMLSLQLKRQCILNRGQ